MAASGCCKGALVTFAPAAANGLAPIDCSDESPTPSAWRG